MEIERKYLIANVNFSLDQYPCRLLEQGYLNTSPVVRIRRDNDKYELTYKSGGLMARQEYNMPLNESSYEHLKEKIDGRIIRKHRYMIPLSESDALIFDKPASEYPDLVIELDIFDEDLSQLILAEVEFPTEEMANHFTPPSWFGPDVTFDGRFHNSYLSQSPISKFTP